MLVIVTFARAIDRHHCMQMWRALLRSARAPCGALDRNEHAHAMEQVNNNAQGVSPAMPERQRAIGPRFMSRTLHAHFARRALDRSACV